MATWIEGQYGSHYLRLGEGLTCSINWSSTRNDPYPYRVRIFGENIGGAKTLDAAKLNTEKLAADRLKNALKKLETGEATDGRG